jgi:pimeloyl-ACP methyl ester carboxylesterase
MVVNISGSKENQPVMFIHGFPLDRSMWDSQISFLRKNYYCITYDVRGLGSSYVGDGQYTMEAYVNDLFSIIGELNIEKPVLCGLSMGGYIALRAVEKSQRTFKGLILCNTKSIADDNKGKLVRAEKINKINTDGLDSFIDDFVPDCFAKESLKDFKEIVDSTVEKAKQNNPLGIKGALIAMLSRTDTTESLSKIQIPTLVIAGSFDKLTPPEDMRKIADNLKNSEFAIVPRAGHLTPLENPGMVNDLINGFLKRRIK